MNCGSFYANCSVAIQVPLSLIFSLFHASILHPLGKASSHSDNLPQYHTITEYDVDLALGRALISRYVLHLSFYWSPSLDYYVLLA
jgi:hypothetical protein